MTNLALLLEYENRYYDLGYDYIIGLDEAGRGPMAGELVVAGVIFPKGFYDERIFDSKQLTAKKREAMYQIIIENKKLSTRTIGNLFS